MTNNFNFPNHASPDDSPASATEGTLDRAVQGAHTMVDRVADRAGPAVERVHSTIDSAAESVKGGGEELCAIQQRWADNCRTCVREHPLATLGFAVAAGMVLSRLLRR